MCDASLVRDLAVADVMKVVSFDGVQDNEGDAIVGSAGAWHLVLSMLRQKIFEKIISSCHIHVSFILY